ncbi:MAG: hypothetical protein GY749_34490 [Desulfobacteraceae bacterium]|nr:hypothetical protein [Desulfobacteraceae bacterium]
MKCECGRKFDNAFLWIVGVTESEDTDGSPIDEIEVSALCDSCGRRYYGFMEITEMQLEEEESCQTDG